MARVAGPEVLLSLLPLANPTLYPRRRKSRLGRRISCLQQRLLAPAEPVKAVDPLRVEIFGDFNVRGNIKTTIRARYERPVAG